MAKRLTANNGDPHFRNLKSDFDRDGFIVIPKFFSVREIGRLQTGCENKKLQAHEGDATGVPCFSADDVEPSDISCLRQRVLRLVQALLNDDVRYIHSKVLDETEAPVGGSWPWHQDYWYAYQCGFLFPDMASTVIALHRTTLENGALQVVRGSHKMGRLDHVLLTMSGSRLEPGNKATKEEHVWIGADPLRVEEVIKRLPVVNCSMEKGDILIFHANCLHRSRQNCSTQTGRALLCSSYSASWNEPAAKPQG
ncbi:MAG TPA: phytanoyl-CoA dioxygenase family protein [Terriglobales bacterium]|jgi:ectoine hydroxylase-related dioxygenase (phytanoyl-CoA dioxygenase family)|nr:phytanoyl-CoA dioxygenase family protein [Terriglobales bacterium]